MFEDIIRNRLDGADDSLASQAQFYFDSVWAAALGLHKVASGKSYYKARTEPIGRVSSL